MLAGPIIKGDVGAAEAKRMAGIMMLYLGQARASTRSSGVKANPSTLCLGLLGDNRWQTSAPLKNVLCRWRNVAGNVRAHR